MYTYTVGLSKKDCRRHISYTHRDINIHTYIHTQAWTHKTIYNLKGSEAAVRQLQPLIHHVSDCLSVRHQKINIRPRQRRAIPHLMRHIHTYIHIHIIIGNDNNNDTYYIHTYINTFTV